MKTIIEPVVLAVELKDYRMKKGLTQNKMAELLGVQRYTYIRWEKAIVRISPMMFRHLVRMNVLPKKLAWVRSVE